jgi:hypothetical protein
VAAVKGTFSPTPLAIKVVNGDNTGSCIHNVTDQTIMVALHQSYNQCTISLEDNEASCCFDRTPNIHHDSICQLLTYLRNPRLMLLSPFRFSMWFLQMRLPRQNAYAFSVPNLVRCTCSSHHNFLAFTIVRIPSEMYIRELLDLCV